MRVLYFGDSQATGFGTVTKGIGQAMLAMGIDVRFVSQNDALCPRLEFGGPHLPDSCGLPEWMVERTVDLVSLPWAENALTGEAGTTGPSAGLGGLLDGTSPVPLHSLEPYGGWVPDAAIMLGDFYAARHIVGRYVEAFKKVPTLHYCPVEGVDLPPLWKEMWDIIIPVAMTEFGADQIEQVVGWRPTVVYHGVDTDTFRPVSSMKPMWIKGPNRAALQSKDDCKRAWVEHLFAVNAETLERRPDGKLLMPTKWLLRTDRHMPRKRYDAMLRALGPVLERNTGWGLVIHCNGLDQGGYLPEPISKLSPKAQSRIMFTDNGEEPRALGMPAEQLAILYNAADLYVSVSAEGFGLTIAEAIACGIPAVGLDYSAVPEVIGPAGVTVPYTHLLDNEYGHSFAAIDEAEFARTVEHLMTHQGKRDDLGRKGPKHVRDTFRWDTAARQFVDLIQGSLSARKVAA